MNRVSNHKFTGIIILLILASLYFGQSLLPEVNGRFNFGTRPSQVLINQDDSPHTLLIDGTKVELRLLGCYYNHDSGVLQVTIRLKKDSDVPVKVKNPRAIIVFNNGTEIIRPLHWEEYSHHILMPVERGTRVQIIDFRLQESQFTGNNLRLEWRNPDGTPVNYPPLPFRGI